MRLPSLPRHSRWGREGISRSAGLLPRDRRDTILNRLPPPQQRQQQLLCLLLPSHVLESWKLLTLCCCCVSLFRFDVIAILHSNWRCSPPPILSLVSRCVRRSHATPLAAAVSRSLETSAQTQVHNRLSAHPRTLHCLFPRQPFRVLSLKCAPGPATHARMWM